MRAVYADPRGALTHCEVELASLLRADKTISGAKYLRERGILASVEGPRARVVVVESCWATSQMNFSSDVAAKNGKTSSSTKA